MTAPAPTVPAIVDPTGPGPWADLVDRAGGSLFTSPPWLRAIATTYPHLRLQAHVVSDPSGLPEVGAVSGVIDDVLGPRLVSTPYCDFCDPVAVDGATELDRVVDALLAFDGPVRLRVLEPPPGLDDGRLTETGHDFWHGVGLDREVDEMEQSLGSTARRNVRKARSAGVTVRFASDLAAVDTFFGLHQLTRRAKHGMLAQPRPFFHAIHEEFGPHDGVHVALAEAEGRAVAGIFLLEWGGRAYYKFNASDPADLALRPNDLLMWESMQWAQSRGNQLLDLGLSDADQPGLLRYKRKFATAEGRVRTLVAGPGPTAGAQELRPVLGQLTDLLCDERVPLDVAERAGNLLYRYFT